MDLELLLKETLEKFLKKTDGETPPNLSEAIRYSLLAPGKRIRPRLLLAAAEMLGLSKKAALPAGLALEMVHCFTLIHDDLPCMDNDDFRRGMPSNHKKFGESLALLAGDALTALAVDVFLDSDISAEFLKAGLKRLVWAMGPRGVIGGQAAESLLGSRSQFQDLKKMHQMKTGALFSAAVLIPKDFLGISDSSELGQILIRFADELGFAFQVADDLEDAGEQKEIPSTSILSYLSASEAAQMVQTQLSQISQTLKNQWGSSAEGLCAIATEVIQKTQTALPSPRKGTPV